MPIQGMDKGDCIDKTTHGIVSISDIDISMNFIKTQIEQGSSTKPICLKLWGTIYSTSMYCAMAADNTRRDAANQDSYAGKVGHSYDRHVNYLLLYYSIP
jgi:hypothetical protein